MAKRDRKCRGNALLEMMLFIPLALLLLFVGLDGALIFNTRGATRSAIRDGLNSEQVISREQGVWSGTFDEPRLDLERAQRLVDNVVSGIELNLSRIALFANADKFKILGKLYLVEIDPLTGRFAGVQVSQISSVRPTGSTFSAEQELPTFSFRSLSSLEEESFSSHAVVHHLAQPIPLTLSDGRHFYPYTLAIGVEVTAIAGGISPGVTRWLLGSYYGIGEATIVPLRLSVS